MTLRVVILAIFVATASSLALLPPPAVSPRLRGASTPLVAPRAPLVAPRAAPPVMEMPTALQFAAVSYTHLTLPTKA